MHHHEESGNRGVHLSLSPGGEEKIEMHRPNLEIRQSHPFYSATAAVSMASFPAWTYNAVSPIDWLALSSYREGEMVGGIERSLEDASPTNLSPPLLLCNVSIGKRGHIESDLRVSSVVAQRTRRRFAPLNRCADPLSSHLFANDEKGASVSPKSMAALRRDAIIALQEEVESNAQPQARVSLSADAQACLLATQVSFHAILSHSYSAPSLLRRPIPIRVGHPLTVRACLANITEIAAREYNTFPYAIFQAECKDSKQSR